MDIEVRPLRDQERAAAGAVAGRALSTSPTSFWIWGDDPVVRMRASLDVFVPFVRALDDVLGAVLGDHVVGVCGSARPGACIGSTATDEMRAGPASIGDPGDVSRGLHIWAKYANRDLDERHWHLGPVSVEPGLQGRGVGALMLGAYGEQLDEAGEVGWLETDKPENVVFYLRHGFDVAVEDRHLGFPIWFMHRPAR